MGNSESANAMRAAAERFLETGGSDGATAARIPFADTAARKDWHYVPRRRAGLALGAMDRAQAKAAHDLVSTGLSLAGFAAVAAIIALEDVLDRTEGGRFGRHRGDYSVTVFDEPSATEPWGWRFEGHHVSLNVTIVDGEVAGTPLFLGANPAEILGPHGHVISRPLAAEEDLVLTLFGAMTPAQRDGAVLGDQAPDDILTAAAPDLTQEGALPELAGVRFGDLTGGAADLAHAMIRLYLDRLPADLADAWWQRIAPDVGDVHLAVAGRAGHRLPQYYRLVGPSLFVEYDNTQDGANHVHTVLRDPEGDFGEDLLRAHRHDHH